MIVTLIGICVAYTMLMIYIYVICLVFGTVLIGRFDKGSSILVEEKETKTGKKKRREKGL